MLLTKHSFSLADLANLSFTDASFRAKFTFSREDFYTDSDENWKNFCKKKVFLRILVIRM